MNGRFPALLLLVVVAAYAWSAWRPADVATWWMEVAPVLLVLPVVVVLERRFGLTRICLSLLALEAVIVAVGAHYTYAEVPLGFVASDLVGFERNHYDRLAHFTQGLVPAVALREYFLRDSPLGRGPLLFGIVVACCLAFSALYEFIEWWAALVFAEGATAFLGTQGDPWDTQWDMFLAMCGAAVAQLAFARVHDRQLAGFGAGAD